MVTNKNDSPHEMSIESIIDKIENPSDSETYIRTDEENKVTRAVFDRFKHAALNRNTTYRYLGNRSLTTYIEDSVVRFISNMDEREGIEDWQARVNVPMTHNKVSTILGKIVSMLPMADIIPRNGSNPKLVSYLSNLYEYSEDIDDYEELMICAVLEAIVKGTVIGYEGYEYKSRDLRDIVGYNDDGTPKYKKVKATEAKLCGSIVPLEQFYPASVSIRRMEDQPYAFRRFVVSYSSFLDVYSCYPRYTHVSPRYKTTDSMGVELTSYNQDLISQDVQDGNVEMIFYYNKDTDEFVLMANGIWLNPMKDFTVAPNPFNHKRLPFWSARFDTVGSDFFYGRSLVDRLQGLQDILNILTNMAFDQSFLTIFPPILTAGIDPIEDDYLRPGRRVPVDTQGLPLSQSFMKLDLGTPGGWHQWMLEYTKGIMEQASVDQVASGQAGVGGRTTAEEIRQAASGVAAILGVFGKLLNTGIKNKAILKTSNIAQFWSNPKTPISSRVLGIDNGLFAKAFNVVTINNAKLSNGRIGTKMMGMYPSKESLPSKAEIKTTAMMDEMTSGIPTEIHAITGETIRNIEFDVKFIPNTKNNDTKDVLKALTLEKIRVYKTFWPQQVNDTELQNDVAQIFGDDPAKIFNPPQTQQPQQPTQEQQNVAQSQQVQTQPSMDMSNNMVRGMMGGEAGQPQMNAMMQNNQ